MITSDLRVNGERLALLASTEITTAVTGSTSTPITDLTGMKYLVVQALFVRGSGGTSAKFWIQTSFDGGTTWTDIMNFAFTTSTASKFQAVKVAIALAANKSISDAALGDNTILDGVLGDRLQVKYTTTGTYGDTSTIKIDGVAKG